MARFSVRVVHSNGQPAEDVGVSYHGNLGGYDEKQTDSDGWVEWRNFHTGPSFMNSVTS